MKYGSLITSFFLLFTVACATLPVENAFDGKFGFKKETRTITEYCQSCHNHRNFDSIKHLSEITGQYSNEPFVSATTCKTCHDISKNMWGDLSRVTFYPGGLAVGQ